MNEYETQLPLDLEAFAGKTIARAEMVDDYIPTELRITTTDGDVFTVTTCHCCGLGFGKVSK